MLFLKQLAKRKAHVSLKFRNTESFVYFEAEIYSDIVLKSSYAGA